MDERRTAELTHAIAGLLVGAIGLSYEQAYVLATRIVTVVRSAASDGKKPE